MMLWVGSYPTYVGVPIPMLGSSPPVLPNGTLAGDRAVADGISEDEISRVSS